MEKKLEIDFISISVPSLRKKLHFCFPHLLPSHRKPSHLQKGEANILHLLCSHITSQLPTGYAILVDSDIKEGYQTQLSSHEFLFSEHLEIKVLVIESLPVNVPSCIPAYSYNQCKMQP